jgi:hypothetical protein
MLQISEATCRYAAAQLGNGIGPEEARQTALFVAGELTAVAETLRRLARLSPAERRALTVRLVADGMSQRQAAAVVGVSKRRAWDYLRARS